MIYTATFAATSLPLGLATGGGTVSGGSGVDSVLSVIGGFVVSVVVSGLGFVVEGGFVSVITGLLSAESEAISVFSYEVFDSVFFGSSVELVCSVPVTTSCVSVTITIGGAVVSVSDTVLSVC